MTAQYNVLFCVARDLGPTTDPGEDWYELLEWTIGGSVDLVRGHLAAERKARPKESLVVLQGVVKWNRIADGKPVKAKRRKAVGR